MPKMHPQGDLSINRPAEGPRAAVGAQSRAAPAELDARRHTYDLDTLEASELTIGSTCDHGTHVVLLAGELDGATAHRVEDELRAIEATDVEQIILDLSGLTFMDSSGAHLIARAAARCTINATRLRLRPGPPHVQRVFALAGTDTPPLVA